MSLMAADVADMDSGPERKMQMRSSKRGAWVGLMVTAALAAASQGAPPRISRVCPDVIYGPRPHKGLRVIVGENFDVEGLQVWVWDAPRSPEVHEQSVRNLGVSDEALPATPPEGAEQVRPLDVEKQVITAYLEGCMVWIRSKNGIVDGAPE